MKGVPLPRTKCFEGLIWQSELPGDLGMIGIGLHQRRTRTFPIRGTSREWEKTYTSAFSVSLW
jgi:hypothetical protein